MAASETAEGDGSGGGESNGNDNGGPPGGSNASSAGDETGGPSPDGTSGGGDEVGGTAEPGGTSAGPLGFTAVGYEFTTAAYGAEYDPDHIVAVWVERGGAFVRTLEVHADKRLEHLIAWRLSSGEDMTDAVTSATIKDAHGPLSGTWDLRDSAGAIVDPGEYTLRMELTADNSNNGNPAGPVLDIPLTVGGAAFDETPAGATGFQNLHVWSE